MSSNQQLADKQIGDKQLTGHFCGGGAWKGQWEMASSLVTPIPVNLFSTLMGLVTPSRPAVHRPWREGGSLANWYELWPRVIIFLRISEVAKQLKGLS